MRRGYLIASTFAAAAAAVIFSVAACAGGSDTPAESPLARWQAGTNYTLLEKPQPVKVARGKVLVTEVFWYGCPHCNALDPTLEAWKLSKPDYVEFVRVPVIWGNTRDEGRLTSATVPEPFDYQGLLEQGFGVEKAAKIAAEYPLSAYGNARLAYGAVLTDGVWACNQLADDRLLARHTPTYGYEFADRTAPMGWFKGSFSADFPAGAAHSFELAYFFDVPTFDLDPAQQRLAATMIRDWTTFARTGKPGWSRYSGGDVQEYSLGPIGQINGLTRHNCSFWNSIG